MTKYVLEKRGFGKFKSFRVKSASGKKIRDLERNGSLLFDSKKDAENYALQLKGNR